MSFMSLSWENVFAYLMKPLNPPILSSNQAWLMTKNPSKCWKKWKEWPRARSSSSTKWCGITMVNKMPCGNGKIIYKRFIQLPMKNGRSFKSQDDISIRGRGYNTLVLSIAFGTCISWAQASSKHSWAWAYGISSYSLYIITCDVDYIHAYACDHVWPMKEMVVRS